MFGRKRKEKFVIHKRGVLESWLSGLSPATPPPTLNLLRTKRKGQWVQTGSFEAVRFGKFSAELHLPSLTLASYSISLSIYICQFPTCVG